jgi:hypothetical protein
MVYTKIDTEHGFVIQKQNENGSVSSIPNDPANSDYQRYLRWLEDPNADEFQPPLEG